MENSQKIKTEVTILESKDKVWESIFTKFGSVCDFNPNIQSSEYILGDTGEIGTERNCALDSKTYVKERIIDVKENHSYKLEIFETNMPMVDKMEAEFIVEELNSYETRVSMIAEFNTKPRFMARFIGGSFKSKLTDLLIGLKYYLETGERIDQISFKPIKKKYKKLELDEAFVA